MSKDTLHIAVVCNYILRPDRIGGMDRFFVKFDSAAKAQGYEVTWFFSAYAPFDFYRNLTILSPDNEEYIEHFFLNYLKKNPHQFSNLITHFTSLCSSFYQTVKKQSSIYKTLVVDHNPRPLAGFSLKKRIKNRIKGFLYSQYIDQFIGVSQYTVNHIIQDLGSHVAAKTLLIYNGIDTSVFKKKDIKKNTRANGLKFAVVSHLRASKGIQDLIEALAQLDKVDIGKIHIDIYGEGPLEEMLKNQVSQNRLETTVTFMGSSSKIPELLCTYDYLLQPTHMECFSLSILESLSANVPVITTTVGGNPEIVSNTINGFLFEARDTQALAKIIRQIITGEKSIKNPTAPLIEKEYNLDKMVSNHLKLIQ